jgi:hypothetical protein
MTEIVPALTSEEALELEAMEEIIHPAIGQVRSLMSPNTAALQALEAFSIIHAKRLYRQQYATFADYCAARWKWPIGERRGYQWLTHARVVVALKKSAPMVQIPNERQSRELALLPERFQAQVWKRLLDTGRKPTAASVRKAVQELLDGMNGQQQLDLIQQSEAGIRAELRKSRLRDLAAFYRKVAKKAAPLWAELGSEADRDRNWLQRRIAALEREAG